MRRGLPWRRVHWARGATVIKESAVPGPQHGGQRNDEEGKNQAERIATPLSVIRHSEEPAMPTQIFAISGKRDGHQRIDFGAQPDMMSFSRNCVPISEDWV
jgi:hypothetical protein